MWDWDGPECLWTSNLCLGSAERAADDGKFGGGSGKLLA